MFYTYVAFGKHQKQAPTRNQAVRQVFQVAGPSTQLSLISYFLKNTLSIYQGVAHNTRWVPKNRKTVVGEIEQ